MNFLFSLLRVFNRFCAVSTVKGLKMFCIAIGSWTLGGSIRITNHLNTLQGGKRKWMVELGHVESFREPQIHTFWNRVARPLDTFSEIAAAATPVLTLLKSSEFRRRIFGQDRKRFTSMCEQVDFLVSKFKTHWILEVEHVLCTSSLFASIFFAFTRVRCRCCFLYA